MEVAPRPLSESIVVAIADDSAIGQARREGAILSQRAGFDESGRGRVALAITEVANNTLRHGGGGELVLRALGAAEGGGIEVLALDRGPGMDNVAQCLRDGFSTQGSRGVGLGALSRIADDFDIHSIPRTAAPPGSRGSGAGPTGAGTAVLLRFRLARATEARPAIRRGVINVAMSGESVSGDGYAIAMGDEGMAMVVADGLGHGPSAAEASRAAIETFLLRPFAGPKTLLTAMHPALRPTRGAAVAIAEVIERARKSEAEGAGGEARILRFSGAGNVAAAIVDGQRHRMVASQPGTVGLQLPALQEVRHPVPDGALVIMHSDGLGSRWSLDRYPGLAARDPALVAGVLYRDWSRRRDDVTVVVIASSRS